MQRNIFKFILVGLGFLVATFNLLAPDTAQAAELGGNAYFDKVFYDNGGFFSDNTAAAANATTSDVPLLDNGSMFASYFGMQESPFKAMYFKMGDWGAGAGAAAKYEYYSGSYGWRTLDGVVDTGAGFLQISGDNLVSVTFTPRTDWVKTPVNGVNAYWVRIVYVNQYTAQPRATQVRGEVFNTKVLINTSAGTPWTQSFVPNLAANCGGYYGGEWNPGNGVHYYALKTSGGDCSLNFEQQGYTRGSAYFSNLTSALSDYGTLMVGYATQVYVQDEAGNTITNAAVLYNGTQPSETSSGFYYFPLADLANKALSVKAIGYVAEDGTLFNTAFTSVSAGNLNGATLIRLIPGLASCAQPIAAGTLNSCSPLQRNTLIRVLDPGNNPLQNATVTIKQGGVVANDLSKPQANDAQATTDAMGQAEMALQAGSYAYTITANGHADANGSLTVTEYAVNNLAAQLSVQAQPDTTVSASMSVVSIFPATVVADNVATAALGVTAKNAAGEALSGKTVTVATSLNGSSVSPASAVTDATGRVNFSVKSSAVGTATLTITAGGVTLTSQPMVQFTAQQQADTTVSASQSTVTFSPASQSAPADGSSLITLTVTAKNAAGTALANKNVTLGGDFSGITVSPASATTNASGQAVFTFKSSAVKSTAITVTAGGVVLANVPTIAFTSTAIDQTVSASNSYVTASPSSVTANGIQTALVTLIVRNPANVALSGKQVYLSSSLGAAVISPAFVITDSSGFATFSVKSSSVGTAQFTATVGNVAIDTKPTVQFVAPVSSPTCQNPIVAIGSLVKLQDDGNPATQEDSAVYYYGKDCKRHAFPNDKVYFTWYTDFNAVTIVGSQTLSAMPLGKNVTYRPGVKMVKFTTLNNVYAVSKGGVLRWVKTEAVATALYGATWNKKIDDISDAFFINYVFGSDISSTADYNVNNELTGAQTIDDTL